MIQTIESREVAKMIGYSRHDNLLQKIVIKRRLYRELQPVQN